MVFFNLIKFGVKFNFLVSIKHVGMFGYRFNNWVHPNEIAWLKNTIEFLERLFGAKF